MASLIFHFIYAFLNMKNIFRVLLINNILLGVFHHRAAEKQ